ncbi:MAG: hypothetical protein O8C63_09590 [Candidatus Methanoperedens sp.]|nr:hypothetical protein [Candidatus Methanoperedens sp.]
MPNMSENELWVQWTHDAMTRYVMPEDIEDADDLADDMTDIAAKVADGMLDEYNKRFGSGGRSSKPSRWRGKSEPEET